MPLPIIREALLPPAFGIQHRLQHGDGPFEVYLPLSYRFEFMATTRFRFPAKPKPHRFLSTKFAEVIKELVEGAPFPRRRSDCFEKACMMQSMRAALFQSQRRTKEEEGDGHRKDGHRRKQTSLTV